MLHHLAPAHGRLLIEDARRLAADRMRTSASKVSRRAERSGKAEDADTSVEGDTVPLRKDRVREPRVDDPTEQVSEEAHTNDAVRATVAWIEHLRVCRDRQEEPREEYCQPNVQEPTQCQAWQELRRLEPHATGCEGGDVRQLLYYYNKLIGKLDSASREASPPASCHGGSLQIGLCPATIPRPPCAGQPYPWPP